MSETWDPRVLATAETAMLKTRPIAAWLVIVLATNANDAGIVRLSLEGIAQQTGCSRRTVNKYLRFPLDARMIVRTRTNQYYLPCADQRYATIQDRRAALARGES